MEYGNNGKNSAEDAVINGKKQSAMPPYVRFILTNILMVIILLIVALGLWTSVYKVDTEEEAVILRFGAFNRQEEPGLHMMLPFGIEKAILVKTGRILKEEFGFRSTQDGSRTSYSTRNYNVESLVLTGDLNVSNLEWIVQYQIDNPKNYLFKVHDPTSTIRDISEAVTRRIVGDATVSDVLTTERAGLALKIQKVLQETLNYYEMGVRIVTVRFQDVNPPEAVKAAFNGVNEAEQQKESLILQAREQYNKEVPKARGVAKKTIQEAEGYALERVNHASGEASRFTSVLNEYSKFPEVTKKRLYLETIERVMKKLSDVTILDDPQGKSSVLPLLPLRSLGSSNSGDNK